MKIITQIAAACLIFSWLCIHTACTKTPVIENRTGMNQDISANTVPSREPSSSPDPSVQNPRSPSPDPAVQTASVSETISADQAPFPLTDKTEVAEWVQKHFTDYYQQYNLSCEAALIRMICGIWGIDDLDEDDILSLMPSHPSNPELGLVMENIQGDVYRADGSINWTNYGAHPPVVKLTLETILKDRKLDSLYRIDQKKLDNKQLITFLRQEPACLGAIIWVAAYIDNKKPPVNEIGQVLGEHVQFVSPVLDAGGRMLVYDVWPWENQPFHLVVPFNRDMFDYETLLIMRKN